MLAIRGCLVRRSVAVRQIPLARRLDAGDLAPGARRRLVARPQWALHQDAVAPMAELEADGGQQADAAKAASLVQAQRRDIGAIDIADHPAVAGRSAGLDQS